jgi:IS30 family transposase
VLLPLADRIKTATCDNGKEFASDVEIATSLGSLSYFAKPYHSWERGLNEHTNGRGYSRHNRPDCKQVCIGMTKEDKNGVTPH